MMWLVPLLDGRDVRFLYLMVWDEEGVRWRREFRTSCCGQWWPWVLRLTTHESGVVRGVVRGSFGGSFGCIFSTCFHLCSLFVPFFYLLLFLSHRLLLLLFSLFPSFTQSYSFSNQTIVAEWLFVMQSSAGRRVVCSARGGLSRVCYNGTLYPSNEGNPLVFWWIAVTLLWPGRGDFSASGLSTFKKIALTSALDCMLIPIGCQTQVFIHFCLPKQTIAQGPVQFELQNHMKPKWLTCHDLAWTEAGMWLTCFGLRVKARSPIKVDFSESEDEAMWLAD